MSDVETARRRVQRELQATDVAFGRHIKKNICLTDSPGCRDRAAYQERLAALRWVVRALGGRVDEAEANTTISDYTEGTAR